MATLAKRAASSSSESSPPPRLAIADFGCSEGANAVEQMTAAVATAFRAFGDEGEGSSDTSPLSITVTHSDLTNNGWNAVASAIAAAGRKYANPPSVVATMQPSDLGFYERCFADEALDLVHGAITFHWASRGLKKDENDACSYDSLPSKLEDASILPALSSDAKVRALAAEASRRDWERILELRARELKRGGFLVAALICAERGDSICVLWTEFARCLKELVEEKIITQEEASSVVVPVHLRTPEDHRNAAPLLKDDSRLFRVVFDEFSNVQSAERDSFLERHKDPEKYGSDVAAFFEAVSRTMVEGALCPRLGKEKATAVADELYFTRFAGRVAATQPDFSTGLQTLVLEKL